MMPPAIIITEELRIFHDILEEDCYEISTLHYWFFFLSWSWDVSKLCKISTTSMWFFQECSILPIVLMTWYINLGHVFKWQLAIITVILVLSHLVDKSNLPWKQLAYYLSKGFLYICVHVKVCMPKVQKYGEVIRFFP